VCGRRCELRAAQAVDRGLFFSNRVSVRDGLLKLFSGDGGVRDAMSLDGAVVTLPLGRERHDA